MTEQEARRVLCDHLAKWSGQLWKGMQLPGDPGLTNETLVNLAGVSYVFPFTEGEALEHTKDVAAAYSVLRPLVRS